MRNASQLSKEGLINMEERLNCVTCETSEAWRKLLMSVVQPVFVLKKYIWDCLEYLPIRHWVLLWFFLRICFLYFILFDDKTGPWKRKIFFWCTMSNPVRMMLHCYFTWWLEGNLPRWFYEHGVWTDGVQSMYASLEVQVFILDILISCWLSLRFGVSVSFILFVTVRMGDHTVCSILSNVLVRENSVIHLSLSPILNAPYEKLFHFDF